MQKVCSEAGQHWTLVREHCVLGAVGLELAPWLRVCRAAGGIGARRLTLGFISSLTADGDLSPCCQSSSSSLVPAMNILVLGDDWVFISKDSQQEQSADRARHKPDPQ